MGDREADVYDFLAAERSEGVDVLVRAAWRNSSWPWRRGRPGSSSYGLTCQYSGEISGGCKASVSGQRLALEARQLDGFWANALGSETAVRRGVGKVVVDVRRGDGPPAARHFTFSALVVTEALIARAPEQIAATVRTIVHVQRALRNDPTQATEVGRHRFPPEAAALIATLVERDLPFYDPTISETAVAGLDRFARALGLLTASVPYEQVVATRFSHLWHAE